MTNFKEYIKELQATALDQITEHSKRGALENLLKSIADDKLIILHEPKRDVKFGAPDFKISNVSGIIGYVENKKIDENLDKILKSAQIKKYKELSDNILLTNYLEWIWIRKGEINGREQICFLSDLENKNFKPSEQKIKNVKQLIENFFSQAPIGVATAKELAQALAIRGRNLRDFLNDELEKQEEKQTTGILRGLYQTFQSNIFNELQIKEFADAFAQMLVYGLFLAKLNADTKKIDLYTAKNFIPQSYSLIKELVNFLEVLEKENYDQIKWIIEEVLSIMNNLNLLELKKDLTFSKTGRQKDFERDPYIYFYEDFLAAYDSSLRKAKGVYYTPQPVVSFIIRSVNEVLIKEFKISNGLADRNKVTVLDFATGTGTFLLEIFRQILDNLPTNSPKKELLIKEHFLKNIFGFEFLIAPYTIAHLKLSQFLKDNKYTLQKNERLQIFLTNTLEPIYEAPPNMFVPALTKEGKEAQTIKDKPILVITGNPPYSISSANKGKTILKLLEDYKKGLNEKKVNLDDDYIKFIRFAHKKMESVENGIIAIITNNSFLDGITHRKMREKLLADFDKIYILNLHGNSRINEITPEGERDENVFDIIAGVSISIFVKNSKSKKKEFFYKDLYGKRADKYQNLHEENLTDNWKTIVPEKPYYLFKPINFIKEYYDFWGLKNIFDVSGSAVKTDRDTLCYDKNRQNLLQRFKTLFTNEFDNEFIEKYNIKNSGSYKLIEKIRDTKFDEKALQKVCYRPFNLQYIYYKTGFTSRPNYSLNKHLLRENVALISGRAGNVVNQSVAWNLVFATNKITDTNIFYRGGGFLFPLYIYKKQKGLFKKEKPSKQILKADKEFKEHQNFFNIAINEYEKHENLYNSKKEATQDETDALEEHKMTIEEYKTTFEKINDNFVKTSQILKQTQNQLDKDSIEIPEDGIIKQPNFSKEFKQFIEKQYNEKLKPEQIFGYIYATLHSQTYRIKYAALLNIDFPRVPFPKDLELVKKLSVMGEQLYKAHILDYDIMSKIKTQNNYKNIGNYAGLGDNEVIKSIFKENKENKEYGKLYINKTQYFENVPVEVLEFYIGGYKVLDKYLKDHKKTKLNLDEIENIENIIKVLLFSIDIMKTINESTNEWI